MLSRGERALRDSLTGFLDMLPDSTKETGAFLRLSTFLVNEFGASVCLFSLWSQGRERLFWTCVTFSRSTHAYICSIITSGTTSRCWRSSGRSKAVSRNYAWTKISRPSSGAVRACAKDRGSGSCLATDSIADSKPIISSPVITVSIPDDRNPFASRPKIARDRVPVEGTRPAGADKVTFGKVQTIGTSGESTTDDRIEAAAASRSTEGAHEDADDTSGVDNGPGFSPSACANQ